VLRSVGTTLLSLELFSSQDRLLRVQQFLEFSFGVYFVAGILFTTVESCSVVIGQSPSYLGTLACFSTVGGPFLSVLGVLGLKSLIIGLRTHSLTSCEQEARSGVRREEKPWKRLTIFEVPRADFCFSTWFWVVTGFRAT
jgi:hypothetical protein